jgi:hypothetical protein
MVSVASAFEGGVVAGGLLIVDGRVVVVSGFVLVVVLAGRDVAVSAGGAVTAGAVVGDVVDGSDAGVVSTAVPAGGRSLRRSDGRPRSRRRRPEP